MSAGLIQRALRSRIDSGSTTTSHSAAAPSTTPGRGSSPTSPGRDLGVVVEHQGHHVRHHGHQADRRQEPVVAEVRRGRPPEPRRQPDAPGNHHRVAAEGDKGTGPCDVPDGHALTRPPTRSSSTRLRRRSRSPRRPSSDSDPGVAPASLPARQPPPRRRRSRSRVTPARDRPSAGRSGGVRAAVAVDPATSSEAGGSDPFALVHGDPRGSARPVSRAGSGVAGAFHRDHVIAPGRDQIASGIDQPGSARRR